MNELVMPADEERTRRLDDAVAEYETAAAGGNPPAADEFLGRNPDLRAELTLFLAGYKAARQAGEPTQGSASPTVQGAELAPATSVDAPSVGGTIAPDTHGTIPGDPAATADHSSTPPPDTATVTNANGSGSGNGVLSRGTTIRYFGDYEVQQVLGRGGMGVVYRARQVSLNRPVALKMIKAGVLADEVDLRRFQNEAEAVALLDHPGIVAVYEVGEHDGQRYFSMKLVEGGNLADRLDEFKDSPKAVAALLAEVAEAVHHAHMRGILHRDLKPANILVDVEGHPHVTDFGLAKRVEDDAGMTLSGAILGTPSYMAPEQAAGRRRGSITTATDVYGLGAVLYALLASRPPFAGDSVIDTLAMVRDRAPEPPHKLNARVPRDLETICLKCLEKDARRRYSSAQAIADDLRRWLENRAISARPVGSLERLGLWARRRPGVASLTAAVVLAAVGGVAAVIAVQEQANRRLNAKNLELAAEKARVEVEKTRVQQRFELAQEAIRTFHSGVSEDVLLKEPQFENLRTRLLGGASEFYGKLEALLRGQTDRASRAALGRAYNELGGLTDQIGNKAKALEVRRKALAVRRALAEGTDPVDPAKLDLARELVSAGWLNYELHHYEEFAAQAEEAAALTEGLRAAGDPRLALDAEAVRGQAHERLAIYIGPGESDKALDHLAKAIDSLGRVLAAAPDDRETQVIMAECLMESGGVYAITFLQPSEARDHFNQSVALYDKMAGVDRESVAAQAKLAHVYGWRGRYWSFASGQMEAAKADFERARAIRRRLVGAYPTNTYYRHYLGWTEMVLGDVLASTGRTAEALAAYDSAAELIRPMVERNPSVFKITQVFRCCLVARGDVLADLGRWEEAAASFAEALAAYSSNPLPIFDREAASAEAEAARSPDRTDLLSRVVASTFFAAEARVKLGQFRQAESGFRRVVAIREEIVARNPSNTQFAIDLARTSYKSAVLTANYRSADESLPYFDRAVEGFGRVAADEPGDNYLAAMAAQAYRGRAAALARLGRLDEARRDAEAGLVVRRAMASRHPARGAYRLHVGYDLAGLSRIARLAGRKPDALAAAVEAVELHRPLIDAWPHENQVLFQGGQALLALAGALLDDGRTAEAASHASRAAELLDRMIPELDQDFLPRARAQTLLATLADRESGPASAGRSAVRDGHLAAAMRALSSAVTLGFRNGEMLDAEPDFDRLRILPDFQMLRLDLNFPADPFTR